MPLIIRVTHLAVASLVSIGAANPSFPELQTFTVPLSGQAETNIAHPTGGTGDPDGSGTVRLRIAPTERRVCYEFQLSGISEPLMAHILQAPAQKNGPPIVSLFTGTGEKLDGCAQANTLQLADMIAHPSEYYVSVATTEFPDGALRGQL